MTSSAASRESSGQFLMTCEPRARSIAGILLESLPSDSKRGAPAPGRRRALSPRRPCTRRSDPLLHLAIRQCDLDDQSAVVAHIGVVHLACSDGEAVDGDVV